MSRTKPCMLCNAPLDNDECRTPGCAFNPAAEMEVHDSEWTYDENAHQEVGEFDPEDLPHADEGDPDPEFVNADLPDTGDLEGDFSDPEAEQKEAAEDADTMNLSQEDLPEDDLTREEREDLEKEGQEKPKDQQLTEEDKGEDPSDDAMNLEDAPEDDDPDLPPKPQGCSGDCQPGELGEDGDPCPHCTAKSFKQEMEEQGKQHQSEEEMEQDWQNFIDDWQKQAGDDQQGNGQGDQGDEDVKDLPGEHEPEGEQKLEDRQPPDLADDDDDLPPRPQGCQGDCKPGNQFDDDADPCPHCTAKSFRDEMLDEIEDTEGEDLPTDEEIAERFQDFLRDWQEQQSMEQKLQEMEQEKEDERKPDEIDEAPPEDEMQDGMPPEKPEKKAPEHEDDSDEFKRMAEKLTVTQEKRFDNIVKRIEKKVESTFGQTAEDVFVQAKSEGQFKGEEISQSIQITSRGVTYWITISAAKEI